MFHFVSSKAVSFTEDADPYLHLLELNCEQLKAVQLQGMIPVVLSFPQQCSACSLEKTSSIFSIDCRLVVIRRRFRTSVFLYLQFLHDRCASEECQETAVRGMVMPGKAWEESSLVARGLKGMLRRRISASAPSLEAISRCKSSKGNP